MSVSPAVIATFVKALSDDAYSGVREGLIEIAENGQKTLGDMRNTLRKTSAPVGGMNPMDGYNAYYWQARQLRINPQTAGEALYPVAVHFAVQKRLSAV